MTRHVSPFPIEGPLSPSLDRALDYWRNLLRGGATVPFADDVDMGRVQELCGEVFVLGVFQKPERFRLELARTPHAPAVERELQDRFIDDVDLPTPLEFLRSQAAATTESMAPTFYEHRPRAAERGYGRLLLPFWGGGQVSLVLGAVEFR